MTGGRGPVEAPAGYPEHLAAARQAQRDGRRDAALAAYAAALAASPGSATAALALIRLLDEGGDRRRAQEVLRDFVAAAGTSASLAAAARQWEAWQETPLPNALTVRIAVTGGGTLGPLAAHLRVACAQAGLHPYLHVGDFNQWAQDLLPASSPLYVFAPDLIVLVLPPEAIFPTTMGDADADAAALAAERAKGLAHIEALLDAATRSAPTATVVVNTFATPDRSPFGILDLQRETGQRARLAALNLGLVDLARARRNVLLLDQDRVEARVGKGRVRDARLWYLGALPFSDAFLPVLAAEYLRIIRPLRGLVRKGIVLDLDNTLWGGVIGEDGPDGIKLGGTDAPGNAFQDFQRALDGLRRRGILLAICSRNNPEDVWPVIASHPGMVLRRDHFVAVRVNWQDKASNIRELARELNIGLDSLVFLDDNPAERALVRQQVPEVLTVDLPADPALYTQTLLDLDVFETLGLTDEDRGRSDMYRQAQARRAFEASTAAVDEGDLMTHLASLEITVRIAKATPATLPRIAQLINKTNQFNLTTRRYTEAQVRAMAEDVAQTAVYAVAVADRFGDLGLTGVAIVQTGGDVWTIDSFLLSCRVLGRGVEDALLAHLVARARQHGARAVHGEFIPTAKNAPAQGFYAGRGFHRLERSPDGDDEAQVFVLPTAAAVATDHLRWLRVTADD